VIADVLTVVVRILIVRYRLNVMGQAKACPVNFFVNKYLIRLNLSIFGVIIHLLFMNMNISTFRIHREVLYASD